MLTETMRNTAAEPTTAPAITPLLPLLCDRPWEPRAGVWVGVGVLVTLADRKPDSDAVVDAVADVVGRLGRSEEATRGRSVAAPLTTREQIAAMSSA